MDYFCLIGASDEELQIAIQKAKKDEITFINPQILSRTPEIEKPSIAFPSQVTEVGNFNYLNYHSFVSQINLEHAQQRISKTNRNQDLLSLF